MTSNAAATSTLSAEDVMLARQRVLPLVRRLEFREQAVLPPLQTLLGVYELVCASTGNHDVAVLVASREARRTIDAQAATVKYFYPDAPGKLARGIEWTPATLAAYCEQSAKQARSRLQPDGPQTITIGARQYRLYETPAATKLLPPLIGLAAERATLEAHLRNLFMYDPVEQRNGNTELFPHGITLAGPPGTGKSSLLTHMSILAHTLQHIANTPCTIATYDASRFSSYFGRSTRILKRLVNRAKDPRGVGLLVMEDADMVFQNRADGNVSRGVLEVQQYLMNALSGMQEDRGNFLAVFTTNRVENFDEALRSRFGVTYTIDPFARLENHKEYFSALTPHLSKPNCEALGAASFSYGLRGRDLAAVLTSANACVARIPTDIEIRTKQMDSPPLQPTYIAYSNAIISRSNELK